MTESIRSAASEFSISPDVWQDFYDVHVKAHQGLIKGYMIYVREMASRDLPPIFEGRHLSQLLGLTPTEFARYSTDPDTCYRSFEIAKRSGGVREISTPWPKLLESQKWIDWNILRKMPVHDSAHGFVTGRSNISHARQHLGAKKVLCVDVEDFFGSIGDHKVLDLFLQAGYPKNVGFLLSKLCTRFGSLPQGGAASPQISNVVMVDIDQALTDLCNERGYKYSRYVDDITISGPDVTRSFSDEVANILLRLKLGLKDSKTRLQSKRQVVTGISIGSGALRLPRSMRRSFKNEAFLSLKKLDAFNQSELSSDPIFFDRALGQLSYWASVEPENTTVSIARAKLISRMREI